MIFDLDRIGAGLPFAAVADDVRVALEQGAVVVQAPAGSGKTTLVPPLVAEVTAGARPGRARRVVVTAPRRVVVRAAYRRLASLSGRPERVGYTVRGERQVSGATAVEFVTPGVLLRRLLADPDLPGVAAVVLDEVHERDLDTDLLVEVLADLREVRPELTLVAMSATVDAVHFARLLGAEGGDPAPIVTCPAASHPLTVDYAPAPGPATGPRGVERGFLEHVAAQAERTRREDADTLVFLPGAREVAEVAGLLRGRLAGVEVLELHGSVPARQQDRAVAGRAAHEPPRIVVSTSLAESSLTVPGVRVVIDSGLARQPRRDSGRGLHGLVTVTESRASASQRAGRAARLGPGRVVRCFPESRFERMEPFAPPAIQSADLSSAMLTLAVWGTPGAAGVRLPTPPPAAAAADAIRMLSRLGALDPDGRATDLGRRLAQLPLDPGLGRALLDGAVVVGAEPAAEVVAMLAGEPPGGDLVATLKQLRAGGHPASRRWAREAARLARLAMNRETGHERSREEAVGFVTALAYPEWVAHLEGGSYKLASGTRAGLPPGSPLAGQEWIAAAEVTRAEGRSTAGTGALIRGGAPISRQSALRAASRLVEETTEVTFRDGSVSARRLRRLGGIQLSADNVRPDRRAALEAAAAAVRATGLGLFRWGGAASRLRRRLALLHRVLGPPWPDVGDAALVADLDNLRVEMAAIATGTRADQVALTGLLRRLLPWPDAARLDALAPERLAVPSGRTATVDYPEPDDEHGRPVVAVKLQECFGLAETPRLVDGRVPVVMHLLSPAGRPLAVTDDLASFWSGPYRQVRAEMRGRYPKHPWPEDPWTATPSARTRNGGRRTGPAGLD